MPCRGATAGRPPRARVRHSSPLPPRADCWIIVYRCSSADLSHPPPWPDTRSFCCKTRAAAKLLSWDNCQCYPCECARVHYAQTVRAPCEAREEEAASVHRTTMSKQSRPCHALVRPVAVPEDVQDPPRGPRGRAAHCSLQRHVCRYTTRMWRRRAMCTGTL